MDTEMLMQTATPREQPGGALRAELLENDQVEVIETRYAPGDSVPEHTHRFPGVVYTVEGGTLEATGPDGRVERRDMVPGQAFWRAAQSHRMRNIGSTPVRIVEVDVKSASGGPDRWQQAPPMVTSGEVGWTPDSFDPRRSVALLAGDPTRPGPYTVRYRVPAGYVLGLHLHPDEDEQLTVLSGEVHWSSGEAGSGAPEHVLTAGGFAPAPAGTPHRIWTTRDSVLQLTGMGPRTYVYLNPADDPRTAGG